jgi:ribonuclease P/MRP protein subunit POP1
VNQSNSNENSSLIRHTSIKVILPSGWGKILWNRLVFCGAKHQGQWYLKKVASFSSRNLYFPLDYPSTEAYREFSSMVQNTLKQKYDLTPPAKRINYSLLDVKYPFGVDFDQFIWDTLDTEKFPPCLLFTNSIIKKISLMIQQSTSINILTQVESLLNPLYLASQMQHTSLNFASFLSTILIPVICTSDSKGLCSDYSIIYKRSLNTNYDQDSSLPLTIKVNIIH